MGEKDFTGKLVLFDCGTGEQICEMDNVKEVSLESDQTDLVYDKNTSYRINRDPTLEITFEDNVETEKLYEIFGVDLGNKPDAYTILVPIIKQRRKHKKKRINKKWLKRYGYNITYFETKGWKLKSYTDGRTEFIKD